MRRTSGRGHEEPADRLLNGVLFQFGYSVQSRIGRYTVLGLRIDDNANSGTDHASKQTIHWLLGLAIYLLTGCNRLNPGSLPGESPAMAADQKFLNVFWWSDFMARLWQKFKTGQ